MKKRNMLAILGSSGRDCILIILFQLHSLELGFLGVIYSVWVSITSPSPNFILEEKVIQYKYNFMQFLINLS